MTSLAPAAMPSEEEIARAVCASDFDGDETVYDTLSSAQRLNFAINARAIAKLFAPILAEKERLSQKVRELALLLDRQMGTPCEQIRHHHAYADLTAIAEKRQDEADQQAARADAAEARALAAESALAAEQAKRNAIITLLYTDEVFVGSHWEDYPNADKGVWPALAAHVSSFGADAEGIPEDEIIPLADLVDKHGRDAVEAWACYRRNIDKPEKGQLTEQGKAALTDLKAAAAIRAKEPK